MDKTLEIELTEIRPKVLATALKFFRASRLDEVPFGSYVFHVEMMGYKPVMLERFFREEKVDLGTIRLQVDEQFLKAAVVTDVGNPIVVKKDTVEFNASSFRVGANAMLKDLLQRMPGMEITDDGKVKFNGEEIDKLTVAGRTFFFSDQSTALNNLPASGKAGPVLSILTLVSP